MLSAPRRAKHETAVRQRWTDATRHGCLNLGANASAAKFTVDFGNKMQAETFT